VLRLDGVILSVQNSLYCDPIHRYGRKNKRKDSCCPTRGGKRSAAMH